MLFLIRRSTRILLLFAWLFFSFFFELGPELLQGLFLLLRAVVSLLVQLCLHRQQSINTCLILLPANLLFLFTLPDFLLNLPYLYVVVVQRLIVYGLFDILLQLFLLLSIIFLEFAQLTFLVVEFCLFQLEVIAVYYG